MQELYTQESRWELPAWGPGGQAACLGMSVSLRGETTREVVPREWGPRSVARQVPSYGSSPPAWAFPSVPIDWPARTHVPAGLRLLLGA